MAQSAPGWHPDPWQRYEYRFWDGAAWSDHVSSNGAPFTDPVPSDADPGVGQAPVETSTRTVAPPPPGGRGNKGILLGVAGAVAIVVIVAGVLLLGGKGGGGTGTFTAEVTGGRPVVRDLSLSRGQSIGFSVDPESSFDPVIALALESGAAEQFSDQYGSAFRARSGEDFGTLFSDASDYSDFRAGVDADALVLFTSDPGSSGDTESDYFVAPVSGTYHLIVYGYDGDGGTVTITIERGPKIDLGPPGDTSALDNAFSDPQLRGLREKYDPDTFSDFSDFTDFSDFSDFSDFTDFSDFSGFSDFS